MIQNQEIRLETRLLRTQGILGELLFVSCLVVVNMALLTSPRTACAQIADLPVEELIQHLNKEDANQRRDAAYELVRRRAASPDVAVAFAKAVSDNDKQVRFQALLGLARMGNSAEVAIEPLVECLSDRDDQIRFRAADALGKIGAAALDPLTKAWEKGGSDVRIAIAQSLTQLGPLALPATELLKSGLTDAKSTLPRYAAEALVAIAPSEESTLLELASHEQIAVRRVGIAALAASSGLSDAAIDAMRKGMHDEEPKVRETAVIALAKSPLPRQEKEQLVELALVDPVESVRAAAIVAMQKAGLADADYAMRIADKLKTAEAPSLVDLIKAISEIGPAARGTLPKLVEILPSQSIDEALVSSALASFGEAAVADLLASIEAKPELEPTLSRALAMIGQPAVDALLAGMRSDNDLVRLAATRAIGGIEPLGEALIERLAEACIDPTSSIRIVAAQSLMHSSLHTKNSRTALLNAMRDADPLVRAAALPALARVDFTDDEKQSILVQSLADASADVRASALIVIAEHPVYLVTHIDKVLELVSDPDAVVRGQAAAALGKLDKEKVGSDKIDNIVAPALVIALGDPEHSVRIAATTSVQLLAITNAGIAEAIAANLNDDFELLRVSLEAMATLRTSGEAFLTTVSHLLQHERADVRSAAITALAAMDQNKERLANQLTAQLEDPEWAVRRLAGEQLGKLGPAAKDAVPKLFSLLRSDEDTDYANNALREINTAPIEAIPILIENLDSEERRVAFYAVSLLGKIGPPAAEALPKLEEMLGKERDRSDFRKKFLREAISAIKGGEE